MRTFYIYKTVSGQFKISESYCPHVFRIQAKTLAAAKAGLTNYKKKLKEDGTGE
jgi:hypothetical protein